VVRLNAAQPVLVHVQIRLISSGFIFTLPELPESRFLRYRYSTWAWAGKSTKEKKKKGKSRADLCLFLFSFWLLGECRCSSVDGWLMSRSLPRDGWRVLVGRVQL